MGKQLQELMERLEIATVHGKTDVVIADITQDSREVKAGTLFVCLTGAKTDGHQYIEQACRQGAAAILVERLPEVLPAGVTFLHVSDTRTAMQVLAPHFFDYPSRKLRMIGVTGTNGKTTTTYLLKAILTAAGFQVGVIGTIQNLIGERVVPAKNTTPDVIELQRLLAEMAACGIQYVVMEVSSHALALNRVAGCEFDTAIFTNMTQDHLDFHKTLEDYLAAKAKLFTLVSQPGHKQGKTAVINQDDAAAAQLMAETTCPVVTYGIEQKATLQAQEANIQANGTEFVVAGPFGKKQVTLKITGFFNVYNVLGAMGAALAEGIAIEEIIGALKKFESVPGRFELVQVGQPFSVIVDYAHTPDGLENILQTAQQIATERIIVVFGCGGDRDRTKRPIMGRIAVQYGDVVIATSDNPRTEEPESILSEIEVGIRAGLTSDKVYEKIVDRRTAIERAMALAKPDDVVIIAGKGHENYQILRDKTIHFDDKEVARAVLGEMF